MKTNLIFTIVIAVMFAMIGCQKEGCTDSKASNYDPDAKKDNGTCVYPLPEPDPEPDPRDQYTGNYLVTDSTFMLGDFYEVKTYTLQVTIGSSKGDTIFLNNLWNRGHEFVAIMSGSNFSIPSQQVDGPYYADGNGKFEGNTIVYTTSGDVYINKGTGTKQ
ncbi:MAG: hypothetical protein J6T63_00525 [Bacteroidales bacterium]|nr:hypothetical protein [Bacteroidales bacterium]